eukprot:8601240-Karenia_brevis.AAC.1
MEILGTIVSSTGDPLRPVKHRLGKATSAFWALSKFLQCPELSLQQRFAELRKRVYPVALYGAGAWVWSRSVYNELARWENAHLRAVA